MHYKSQLDYAIFRSYSGRLGRFMQQDPGAGFAEDPQSLDLYAYTRNDPENFVDPLGLYYEWIGNCLYEVLIPKVTVGGKTTTEPPQYYLVGCVWSRPGSGGGGGGWRFTLGLRAPNQTFNQCMQANAGNYSALGVADFALNANGKIADNFWLGLTPASNTITNVYNTVTGSLTSALQLQPQAVQAGMGSVVTSGRRTSSIMSLNLAGTPGGSNGGVPALGPVPSNAAQAAKAAAASLKLAVDAGFFLAEAAGCLGPR